MDHTTVNADDVTLGTFGFTGQPQHMLTQEPLNKLEKQKEPDQTFV